MALGSASAVRSARSLSRADSGSSATQTYRERLHAFLPPHDPRPGTSDWPQRSRRWRAAPRGISRQGNDGVPCKVAQTPIPTEPGRARSSCYTELGSRIS
jgi:hypothetical protein